MQSSQCGTATFPVDLRKLSRTCVLLALPASTRSRLATGGCLCGTLTAPLYGKSAYSEKQQAPLSQMTAAHSRQRLSGQGLLRGTPRLRGDHENLQVTQEVHIFLTVSAGQRGELQSLTTQSHQRCDASQNGPGGRQAPHATRPSSPSCPTRRPLPQESRDLCS